MCACVSMFVYVRLSAMVYWAFLSFSFTVCINLAPSSRFRFGLVSKRVCPICAKHVKNESNPESVVVKCQQLALGLHKSLHARLCLISPAKHFLPIRTRSRSSPQIIPKVFVSISRSERTPSALNQLLI